MKKQQPPQRNAGQIAGKLLWDALKGSDISLQSAAAQAGVSVTAVKKLCYGKVPSPTLEILHRLYTVAGLSLCDLEKLLPKVELGEPSRRPGRPRKEV